MILKHLFEITKPESLQKSNRHFGCNLLDFSVPNILLANKQLFAEGTALFWSMQEFKLYSGQISAAMTDLCVPGHCIENVQTLNVGALHSAQLSGRLFGRFPNLKTLHFGFFVIITDLESFEGLNKEGQLEYIERREELSDRLRAVRQVSKLKTLAEVFIGLEYSRVCYQTCCMRTTSHKWTERISSRL